MKLRHASVLWLLFMALFARGMLPGGTMLAFGADKVSVVLCTPQGALVQALDKDGAALKSHHGDTCPFGFALSMAAASATNSLALILATGMVSTSGVVCPTVPLARIARYSARAPPVLS